MARDREIDLSYIPTAEMLADCFTKPLPKPTSFEQCGPMGMIGIRLANGVGNDLGIVFGNGLRNGLGILANGIGNGHGNGIGNGLGNGIGTVNGIGNAVGKHIDSLGTFVPRRSNMFHWLLFSFVYCFVRNGHDSHPGGVLS